MSTELFELVHRQRWAGLVDRCSSCTELIPLQDELGMTVLHWACLNKPTTRVVNALVRLDPIGSICSMRDANGMTPLHCACSCVADIEVIKTIIRAHPRSVLDVDSSGWTCLHYLFSSIENEAEERDSPETATTTSLGSICRLLLQADVTHQLATWSDTSGCNPLDILWQQVNSNTSRKMNDIVRSTILASRHAHFQHNNDPRLLAHVVSSMKDCPVNLALHVLENVIDFTDLDQFDRNGNNCLHSALTHTDFNEHEKDAADKSRLVTKLIELNSKLVKQTNNERKLPIQIAVDNGCRWDQGVNILLLAYPRSVRVLKLHHVCAPKFFHRLHIMDTHEEASSIQSLSIIYEVLRFRLSFFSLVS